MKIFKKNYTIYLKVPDNMEFAEEKIRSIVREVLSKIDESDLIAKKGSKSWSEHKKDFKEKVGELIDKIEDDKYEDAHNLIDDTIEILKTWKKRIKSGLDSKDNVLDEN
jgi:hypothetical protein